MQVNEGRVLEMERRLLGHNQRLSTLESKVTQQGQAINALAGNQGNGGGSGGFFMGVATSAITARSGATLGTGSVEVYSTEGGTLAATGITRTVFNAGAAIASGKHVAVQPDATGTLIAAPLEC